MDEGAEFFLGTDLLGDVDAEAEDVGLAARPPDKLIAIGDDADVAVAMTKMQTSLGLAGFDNLAQVGCESVAMLVGHEGGEGLADHLVGAAAQRFGAVSVYREQHAPDIVGADHA
jgi:hypothetical protein